MTAHNFILLCKRGYYSNVEFHRSIKNFMVGARWRAGGHGSLPPRGT